MSNPREGAVIRIRVHGRFPCPRCNCIVESCYRVCLEWTDSPGQQIELPSIFSIDMSSKKAAKKLAKFWSKLIDAPIEDYIGDKAFKAME